MMGLNFDVNQDYFHWLCELVGVEQEERSYWVLAKDLHRMPFYSLIPHDENRASDGIALREEYLSEINGPRYLRLDLGECTMLEMLIALSRRMDYETADPVYEQDNTAVLFWEMIDNLGLIEYDDASYADVRNRIRVSEILNNLIRRRYHRNGRGGLFPLKRPSCDQRKVEIWYQMNAYLMEKDAV